MLNKLSLKSYIVAVFKFVLIEIIYPPDTGEQSYNSVVMIIISIIFFLTKVLVEYSRGFLIFFYTGFSHCCDYCNSKISSDLLMADLSDHRLSCHHCQCCTCAKTPLYCNLDGSPKPEIVDRLKAQTKSITPFVFDCQQTRGLLYLPAYAD